MNNNNTDPTPGPSPIREGEPQRKPPLSVSVSFLPLNGGVYPVSFLPSLQGEGSGVGSVTLVI